MRGRILFKAKKALIFNLFVVVVSFVALVYAFILLSSKSDTEKRIGIAPFEIFMQYQDGDKVMMFIDDAGELSLRQSSFGLLDDGGVDPSKCAPYFGFVTWDGKDADCMPDMDSLYHQLGLKFSAEMDRRLRGYPNMTFMKYYVGSPQSVVTSSSQAVPAGEVTEGSVTGGLVDIPGEDWIVCADHVKRGGFCKLVPEAIPAIKNIKKYLEEGEKLHIVSATRPFGFQKKAFMRYIKDGSPPACGPHVYRKKIYSGIGAPPKKGDAVYHKKVDDYLAANKAVKDGIENLDNYKGCPHVISKAIDIKIKDSAGTPLSHSKMREIMCKADWVNYGKEWWHYEYETQRWKAQRPDRIPDDLVGSTDDNNYHQSCYYSTLKT